MMSTVYAEGTLTVTQSGAFKTLRWDSGFAVQLDQAEWAALVSAVSSSSTVYEEDEPW